MISYFSSRERTEEPPKKVMTSVYRGPGDVREKRRNRSLSLYAASSIDILSLSDTEGGTSSARIRFVSVLVETNY